MNTHNDLFKKRKHRPRAKVVRITPNKRPSKRLDGEGDVFYVYWVWSIPEDGQNGSERQYVKLVLRPGENGVTKEWVALLRQWDHDERLQNRYAEENNDPVMEREKRNGSQEALDQMEALPDFTYAPETRLFPGRLKKVLRTKELRELIKNHLEPQQQELIYLYYVEQIKQADIAKAAGVSSAAIDGRRRRICAKLRKKFEKNYQIYNYKDLKHRKDGRGEIAYIAQ